MNKLKILRERVEVLRAGAGDYLGRPDLNELPEFTQSTADIVINLLDRLADAIDQSTGFLPETPVRNDRGQVNLRTGKDLQDFVLVAIKEAAERRGIDLKACISEADIHVDIRTKTQIIHHDICFGPQFEEEIRS